MQKGMRIYSYEIHEQYKIQGEKVTNVKTIQSNSILSIQGLVAWNRGFGCTKMLVFKLDLRKLFQVMLGRKGYDLREPEKEKVLIFCCK